MIPKPYRGWFPACRFPSFLCLASAFLFGSLLYGQGDDELPTAALRARSTTILVDVVVRDRDGGAIADLAADDFELYEDGVPQRIDFCESYQEWRRLWAESVQQAETAPDRSAALAQGSSANDIRGSVTALVFGRLSPPARADARRAALHYIEEATSDESLLGVFLVDLGLQTLQFYTSNKELLTGAVERFSRKGTAVFHSNAEDIRKARIDEIRLEERLEQLQAQGGSMVAQLTTIAAIQLVQMNTRMMEAFDVLERDEQGYATTTGLIAVIESLRPMPGRKALVFFSEGIAIPPAVEQRFDSVMTTANRSNVAIYPIDAAGLRIEGTGAEQDREFKSLGIYRLDQAGREGTFSTPMLRMLEKNEDLVRQDPHSGLRRLAENTGGIFIHDTNDILGGLRRINKDLNTYYILAYRPSDTDFDGRFRSIEVRSKLKDVRLQYRRGYYAVDAPMAEPLLDYEAPPIALLQNAQTPTDLPIRSAVLSFPKPNEDGAFSVLADIEPGSIGYRESEDGPITDFCFVAVVRDEEGNIIRKVSQQYQLAETRLGSGKDGILFYRELQLPPGRYSVEVVGFDATSGKAGTNRSTLRITEWDTSIPRLSSVVLVNAVERIDADERGARTPFYDGGSLYYPNLSRRVSKSSTSELVFFFSSYPGETAPKEAQVELLRYDQVFARTRLQLPPAGDDGEIRYVGSIPLEDYPRGLYSLKVSVPSGGKVVSRHTQFLLTP